MSGCGKFVCPSASRTGAVFVGALAGVLIAALAGATGCSSEVKDANVTGDPQKGQALIKEVGCGSCHQIPGINSARGQVGPPLDHIARRAYLAGILPNNFNNLVLWVAEPQTVAPGSAMPNTGVTHAQAEDIAAYLYTLQ